ncbi:hypothetical protein BSNK01_06000 [Bacillaceae bacterium]
MLRDEDAREGRKRRERKKRRKKDKGKLFTRWSLIISVTTFFTAIGISMVSDLMLRKSSLLIALLVLLAIVFIGTLCDILAVAITAVEITPFNSMAAKKVFGAKKCIHIIRNAEKYSNFFADVVGDVAGYIAGFAGATVVAQLILLGEALRFYESVLTVLVAGITSSLIVGSKAVGKNFALQNKTAIVLFLGKALTVISELVRLSGNIPVLRNRLGTNKERRKKHLNFIR